MSRTLTESSTGVRLAEPEEVAACATLVELLGWRAHTRRAQTAYTFLADDGGAEQSLDYGELDFRARCIGAYLQTFGMRGERVMLLYPSGLDYIAAFFGCLYAGAVAVPAYPPRLNRSLVRLQGIVADAQASMVLTTTNVFSRIESLLQELPELRKLRWALTDNLARDFSGEWHMPEVSGDTLALLQYTSGSTSEPKGVMVNHAHLLHNQSMIRRLFGQDEHSIIVGWLPLYHDMGLIGNVLQPLYLGARCVLLSPVAFLQRPHLWLEAITRYRATTSGGPNFAYELCARKVTEEQRAALNLSTWGVAYCGAEPIRHETLDGFARAFEPCGFRLEAMQPCYGLAESTLVVSGGKRKGAPVLKAVEAASLERHRVVQSEAGREGARIIVGCGYALAEQQILIVNPETAAECAPGEVGEIWLGGPSVAGGYWNRAADTEATFAAHLADTGEGPFLRTGDLGFLQDGELFVTGRHKDLIIIRGLNHYPQDIELSVERSHTALRPGCGAAFSVSGSEGERLVVVQEMDHRRRAEAGAALEAIRQAVSEAHELSVAAIVLTKPGGVPKTSSGKIRRSACRQMFLAGELNEVGAWREGATQAAHVEIEPASAPAPGDSSEKVEAWLTSLVASKLNLDVAEIDPDQPIARYGLDSLTAIDLAHQVETASGLSLPMVSFLQGATVRELAERVARHEVEPVVERRLSVAEEGQATDSSPLSFGQKSIWFLQRLAPQSAAFNIARAVRFRSGADAAALRRAFQSLADRHASLRTSFHAAEGEPFQKVHERAEVPFQEDDATAWSDDFLQGCLSEASSQPFDLERAPLLRVRLMKRSADDYVLLLVIHHIVADLWSLVVLMDELFTLYEAERAVATASLPTLSVSYVDFVAWQTAMTASEEGERHWDYWRRRLSGELPLLALPTDRPRMAFRAYRGGTRSFCLGAELRDRLKRLASANGATLYVLLLAAFNALLYRYTGQEDQLVGTSTAGRDRPEFGPLVGYFANTLALRTDLSGDPTFSALLERVRDGVLESFEHQDYPFPLIVERLQPERSSDRSPLFDVMFVLQKPHLDDSRGLASFALEVDGARWAAGDVSLEPVPIERRVAQFDMSLIAAETDDGLRASIEYDSDLFDAATVARMAEHYGRLLAEVAADPSRRISALPLLSEDEERELLVRCNDSAGDYPRDRCVHELFEEQAARTPRSAAVEFDGTSLTYEELNRRANQLANHLRASGVGPETRVAVCLERSAEQIVCLLGVLKAGGAYVPLDPDYPADRLAHMLDDSGAAVLLTQQSLAELLPGERTHTVLLDLDGERLARESDAPSPRTARADNLAYVIYTSGSTGGPKGVCCRHAGVLNLLADFARRTPLDAGDRCSLWTSLSFDVSVYEIFSALLAGATLHIVPDAVRVDFAALADWLSQRRITSAYLPPSMLPEFAEKLRRESQPYELKRLLVGVEPINERLLAAINERLPALRIINGYGPTEATVCATLFDLRAELAENRNTPIGGPVRNTQIYLLDRHLNPVPVGVAGELHISGEGLARGYLNHPGLTAERFMPDPFAPRPGARLYRTGDLARRLPSGDIEFIGRVDEQLKLRGFRIEPGEIQSVMAEHPLVSDCFVMAASAPSGEPQLAAYVVLRQQGDGGIAAPDALEPAAHDAREAATLLRAHLRERLPHYMVPSVSLLDELPLTPNGKIDRRALPMPAAMSGTDTKRPPVRVLTAVEEVIGGIWREVLGVESVGPDDDFFELGGHSLLATRVVSRIGEAFDVEMPLRTLFGNPTVAGIAGAIEKARQSNGAPPPPRIVRAARDAFRVGATGTGSLLIPDAVRKRL